MFTSKGSACRKSERPGSRMKVDTYQSRSEEPRVQEPKAGLMRGEALWGSQKVKQHSKPAPSFSQSGDEKEGGGGSTIFYYFSKPESTTSRRTRREIQIRVVKNGQSGNM